MDNPGPVGTSATPRVLLLDSASLYFRAFFGLPDSLRSPDGRPVNAVRGLLDFIARFVTDYRPTHLACCWDNDWRPQWRVDLLPSYKAHRVSASGGEDTAPELDVQVPLIVQTLLALGLPMVGADGYEADDVIGTLATRAEERGWHTDVVTGDRDLFQLVSDRTRVLYVARGVSKHERVDADWVQHKYAIRPDQYVDFAVLRGDASDGLPGVAGIGEKTAAGLLARYDGLDAIRAAAAEEPSPLAGGVRAKLAAAGDYLDPARTVVAVEREVDLDLEVDDLALVTAPHDQQRWDELVAELGLGSSAERIVTALAGSRSAGS